MVTLCYVGNTELGPCWFVPGKSINIGHIKPLYALMLKLCTVFLRKKVKSRALKIDAVLLVGTITAY
jgi:hypothetical protein